MFLSMLLFFVLTEYRPKASESVAPAYTTPVSESSPGGLRIFSWNTGYFGLDQKMDFFLEGGKTTARSPLETQRNSIESVIQTVGKQEPDICFFQEVDRDSHRSFGIDQLHALYSGLGGYNTYFALNYKSPFVPVPLKAPMGGVQSGLAVFSKFAIDSAERLQLPGEFSWPVRIFHLKRCALVTRMASPVEGKDWYLINVHLSAYDDGGMRKQQLDFLKTLLTDIYAQGHYVVVGGDWNSIFPGLSKDHFGEYTTDEEDLFWLQKIPGNWTPDGWQWCYDAEVPTARSLEQPYKAGENFTCIIDGFLVSPNLRVDEVRGFDLGFKNSDHNPVALTVSIRN